MAYELMIVANPTGGDALLSRVEKLIKENEKSNLKVDRLGRKKLAYPIKRKTEGEYFVINFEANGDFIKPISDKLRLEQEDLLRYLIIRTKVPRTEVKKVSKLAVSKEKQDVSAIEKTAKVTVVTKATGGSKQPKVKTTTGVKKAVAVKRLGGRKKK